MKKKIFELLKLCCCSLSIVLCNTACTTAVLIGGGAAVGVLVLREKPTTDTISDSIISTKIKAALYKISPEVHARVGINVQEGEVLLTGTVPSDDQKFEAEKKVWATKGVKQVYNSIEISDVLPINNYAKDARITSQAKAIVLAKSKINVINYSIKTVNNVVYIFGIANNKEELDNILDSLRCIKGVERVMSYVRLKESSSN